MPEANAPAPAAAQPSAPAPAAAPSQQNVSIDPSAAGRTLAQLRQDRRDALAKGAPGGTDPKASSTQPPSSSASPTTPEPAPARAADDDEDLAVLIETQRQQKETARELDARKADLDKRDAELKDLAEYVPGVKAARDALAKGDHMGALLSVFPKGLVLRDLFWAISKHIDEHGEEGGQPPVDTKAEFERLYKERREAEAAEEQRKRDEAQGKVSAARDSRDKDMGAGFGAGVMQLVKAVKVGDREIPTSQLPPEYLSQVMDGYAEYISAAVAELKRDAAKYPATMKFRPPVLRIVEEVEKVRTAGKAVPATADVLKAIEDALVEDIRATGYAPPAPGQQQPARPAPFSVSSSLQRHEGAAPPAAPAEPETLDQIRERHRAALRQPRAG